MIATAGSTHAAFGAHAASARGRGGLTGRRESTGDTLLNNRSSGEATRATRLWSGEATRATRLGGGVIATAGSTHAAVGAHAASARGRGGLTGRRESTSDTLLNNRSSGEATRATRL